MCILLESVLELPLVVSTFVYSHPLQEGSTALLLASWRGHIDTVHVLVQAHAAVDLPDKVIKAQCVQ